jgi:hypothetical protein
MAIFVVNVDEAIEHIWSVRFWKAAKLVGKRDHGRHYFDPFASLSNGIT